MHQILIHVCISLDRHNDKYDLHPMYWFIWWYPAHNCAISQKKTFTILTNLLGCHHLVSPHRKSDDNEFEGRVSVSNISDPVSYFTVPSAEGNSILWPLSSWIDAISNRARNPGSHSLQWRHNERDAVSNHQTRDCLLNLLFRRRSKKASKLRVTGLCWGNSPVTGELPTQRASNAENVSIWWRHRVLGLLSCFPTLISSQSQVFENHLKIGHP